MSATKQVQFTKGNLWWDGSDFHIEANQTDYPTGSTWSTSHVGHFYWTKTVTTSYAESYDDGTNSSSDVPFFAESKGGLTVDGQSGLYALSSAEWDYLLNTRSGDKAPEIGTQTDARYAEVKVNGVCGLLIFPDAFTWPDGISTSTPTTFNANESNWNSVDYTAAEFILLESAGCVFLPTAGTRYGLSVNDVGSCGLFWSSTPPGSNSAYYLYFSSGDVTPAYRCGRNTGCSARLVWAAQ